MDDSDCSFGPLGKSWVANRYSLVNDGTSTRRRCKFANCDKEYAKRTSHMILKRHWSKDHAEVFDNPDSACPKRSKQITIRSTEKTSSRGTKKKPLGASSSSTNYYRDSSQTSVGGDQRSTMLVAGVGDKSANEIKLVSRRLKEATSIHLNLDIHTPKKGGKSFGIITAHSLGESTEIKSVLLEYKLLLFPDDPIVLFDFLKTCITKFNIKDKIISLASNCSHVVATAINDLDKKFRLSKNFNFSTIHIRCFPQYVHANVMDVLKSQTDLLESVRKVVGFINANNITLQTVELDNTNNDPDRPTIITGPAKATGLKLPSDIKCTWNWTYTMIETFVEQREIIEPALTYCQNYPDVPNVSIDWEKLASLTQLLKPFFDIINKFATENYTPVSLVAVCIPHLMDHLSNASLAYDDLIMAAHKFKLELESYRQMFQSDLTVVAGLLDPRVKDSFVSQDGKEDAINLLRKRIEGLQFKSDQSSFETSIWCQIFRPNNQDEILDYLESPREHRQTNIMNYWETHKNAYPCLYNLAKSLMCVQASSVPSERMYSAAENLDRDRKSYIDSSYSKELMRSWAKYLEK